jgi:integrase
MQEQRVQEREPNEPKRGSNRAKANKVKFTEDYLRDIKMPEPGEQVVIWDEKQIGLSVLLSGTLKTKTYRATYIISHKKEHPEAGKAKTVKIGRVGEMSLDDARKTVVSYRGKANEGDNPVKDKPRPTTFGEVADEFIETYCKANQRTWDQTERILKNNCAELAGKKIAILQKPDYVRLCDRFAYDKDDPCPYKASTTHSVLKTFLRWAESRGYVKTNVLIGSRVEYERRSRDKVYCDDEIRAIWKAADLMSKAEGSYVKLLLLLAPRKTALAAMRRSHLDNADDPKIWTTPHELTKSTKRQRNPNKKKRVYITPLPALAQRILKGLPKGEGGDPLLFPGLSVTMSKVDQPIFNSAPLVRMLERNGVKAFIPHACRHTISTWLETEGCSEWERGLVLNHAGASVTAGYSHGHATKLKLELLEKWAAHVEALITPAEGVAVLR